MAFPFVLALFFVGCAEILLRTIGIGPWQLAAGSLQIEPGGKLTQPHPVLGYSAIPGSFRMIGESGVETRSVHLPNTLRITRPLPRYADVDDRPEIWVFGCSFTYGSGLNDGQTYPWQLQLRLPDYEVVNFGMGGYGTIHSLLQYRAALEEASPRVAVLTYAGFHDIRNTFLRVRQKEVVPYSRLGPFAQPYARLGSNGSLELHHEPIAYRELPLMRHSALAHLIESAYNTVELKVHDSRAVSEALVLEMHRLAQQNGTVFVVADIWNGAGMRRFADAHGIPTVDLSLPRSPRFTLAPNDGHPNANAARIYAERLSRFLRPLLSDAF